jgi:hypothetical protein
VSDAEQPIGDALNALGITATITKDELVAGAIVLLKVLQTDGQVRLSMCHSDGLGWIERAVMLRVADVVETGDARDSRTSG